MVWVGTAVDDVWEGVDPTAVEGRAVVICPSTAAAARAATVVILHLGNMFGDLYVAAAGKAREHAKGKGQEEVGDDAGGSAGLLPL